jgi:hypothetical protein
VWRGCIAADVHVEAKGDGKVITKEGVEYLQVNKIQTKIQVGDSGVKISDKDDKRGLLSEYQYLLMCRDPIPGLEPRTDTPATSMQHTPSG